MDPSTVQSLKDLSDQTQVLSILLETIGMSLAFIELKFPLRAQRIENWIGVADRRAKDFSYRMLQHKWFTYLVTAFITVIFFFEIPYFATDGFEAFFVIVPQGLRIVQNVLFWTTLPIVILFASGLFFVLLSAWISSLSSFSNGHAIGALGVFLASLGIMGGIFQVYVQYL